MYNNTDNTDDDNSITDNTIITTSSENVDNVINTVLEKALNNNKNQYIYTLTKNKIENDKYNILFFHFKKYPELLKEYYNKLKEYFYCPIEYLGVGCYIRWIKKDGLLNTGALVNKIDKLNNKLIIKSLYNKKIFKIDYNEIVIFQKLTNEQLIILLAIEQL